MKHYLTEELTFFRGASNKPYLVWIPSNGDGCMCCSHLTTQMYDTYSDLRVDDPDTDTPEEDLQALYREIVRNGRSINKEGEEINKEDFIQLAKIDYIYSNQ